MNYKREHRDVIRARIAAAIPKRLKRLRNAHGMTQAAFADIFDPPLTRAAVAQWEAGTTLPELDRLATISKRFGVSVQFLIGE